MRILSQAEMSDVAGGTCFRRRPVCAPKPVCQPKPKPVCQPKPRPVCAPKLPACLTKLFSCLPKLPVCKPADEEVMVN